LTTQEIKSQRKYFNEWAKDKSPLLAMVSLALVESAGRCLDMLELFKSRNVIRNFPLPSNIDQWLNLYRNHRKLNKGLTDAYRKLGSEESKNADIYELVLKSFKELKKLTYEERKRIFENLSTAESQNVFTESKNKVAGMQDRVMNLFKDNDTEINLNEVSESDKKKYEKFLKKPETIFFLRVWIPCFLVYRTYPQRLLRKARKGDEEALDKLIRLDKMIVYDPKIKEIFYNAQDDDNRRSTINTITTAIQKNPKIIIDIKKMKYAIAGLISSISQALGQKLTAAEIGKLFNAIAKDSGEITGDDDITVGETFEKEVKRYRDLWQVMPRKGTVKS
jgi:ribosomal protein S17E